MRQRGQLLENYLLRLSAHMHNYVQKQVFIAEQL